MDEQVVGQPVFSENGSKLGTVKEIRGEYVKLDVPLQRDYWLRSDVLRADAGGWLVATADAEHSSEPDETTPTSAAPTATPPPTEAGVHTHPDSAAAPARPDILSGHDVAPETAQATGTAAQPLQLREEQLRVERER